LDIAQDAADFASFTAAVREFFSAADAEDGSRWVAAANMLRANQEEPCDQFPKLPRWSSIDIKANVAIDQLDARQQLDSTPAGNSLPELAAAA